MKKQPLLTCSVFFLLLLFSVLAVLSAIGTYRISVDGSKNLLQTKATDIALSVSFTLERFGLKQQLFNDMLSRPRWDDVAYLALYDQNLIIVLHSNPNLIGIYDEKPTIIETFKTKHMSVHSERLATGEKVFILDFPITLHVENESKIYCLRVALHPYPAEAIVRRANFQLILIGISIVLLWGFTAFFLRFWLKALRLEEELREKEKMAALGEMAAVLAHEIRNPLSSIKGFAQVYQETAESEEEREDFSIIVNEATRLERLTTNLLIYSKPLSIRPEPFSVKEFVSELKKEAELLTPDKNVKITFQRAQKVNLDKEALRQIVLNLLQNALDAANHTSDPEGPKVDVMVSAHKNALQLVVADNGPGIPKDLQAKLFVPFFTTKTKGTGLGLAIVKRLTDLMNGKIKIDSDKGKGTRITIEIPLN
ncbi:sensor histidine kinase [Dissulfuribacter thermophilus]|nr:ATP-binding protein [Dissulfuribacter thermophilus]